VDFRIDVVFFPGGYGVFNPFFQGVFETDMNPIPPPGA